MLILRLGLTLEYPLYIAQAHGGGTPQLTNAQAGPYWVSVWTQPTPLRMGAGHFTISVSEPPPSKTSAQEAGPPILDATVNLQVTLVDSKEEMFVIPATHETAVNKIFYEADIDLPAPGQWQVTVMVSGPAGSGNTRFEIEVLPPSRFNWILLAGLGLVLLATSWLIQRSRR